MAQLSDYLSGTHYKAIVKGNKRITPTDTEDITGNTLSRYRIKTFTAMWIKVLAS
jgi:hypothetical protein